MTASPGRNWKVIGASLAAVIAATAGVAQISGYDLRDVVQDDPGRFEATIDTPEALCAIREPMSAAVGQVGRFALTFDNLVEASDGPTPETQLSIFDGSASLEGAAGEPELAVGAWCGFCYFRFDFDVPEGRDGEGITYEGYARRFVHDRWKVVNAERLGTCLWVYRFRLAN